MVAAHNAKILDGSRSQRYGSSSSCTRATPDPCGIVRTHADLLQSEHHHRGAILHHVRKALVGDCWIQR